MKKVMLGLVVSAAVAVVAPFAIAASADNGNAKLVHVGLNVPACTGTFAGDDSGVVTANYNAVQKREKINVSVHNALPDTTYVVDIRCVGAIGTLTTNSQGTGTAQINLENVASAPGTFYVDISVPPPGGGGAGGYGDTFVAGPFTL